MFLLSLAAIFALSSISSISAQSDLDELMSQVLSRRDGNWKKLQQYVLEERERFQLSGIDGAKLFGFEHDYSWFPREGFFIRSPVRADGVAISDSERRNAEEEWLKEQRTRKSDEPEFIKAAYFMKFKFDPGQYALVGPADFAGRRALKIEYYPTKLFEEGRTRPNRRVRSRDDEITFQMNKASLVTLWIDPVAHQVLQYEFHNIDMDFLPGRSMARVAGADATMRMSQAFPGVWLPQTIALSAKVTLATGTLDARYTIDYHDYRLASATIKVQ
jgi:hypothetical protein